MAERNVIVVTAPSGAGKTTIARRVMEHMPQLQFSVSATTRTPRRTETDGVDYYFVSPEDFQRYIEEGRLVEYEEVYSGDFYGTLRSEIEKATADAPVLLDVDVKGAKSIKRVCGDQAFVIFIKPPSLEALDRRLRGRGTETPESLQTRLDRARMEIAESDQFDAVVMNDDLDRAVQETLDLIRQFVFS